MKNNQFKKQITNLIKEECASKDLKCVFVDASNSNRIGYIYDIEWKCMASLQLWFGVDSVSFRFNEGDEKMVNITQYTIQGTERYLKVVNILKAIKLAIKAI